MSRQPMYMWQPENHAMLTKGLASFSKESLGIEIFSFIFALPYTKRGHGDALHWPELNECSGTHLRTVTD